MIIKLSCILLLGRSHATTCSALMQLCFYRWMKGRVFCFFFFFFCNHNLKLGKRKRILVWKSSNQRESIVTAILFSIQDSTPFIKQTCRYLKLASSLARVRNSGSSFQSHICNLFLAQDLAAIHIVAVIARCLQGESWLYRNQTIHDDYFNEMYIN